MTIPLTKIFQAIVQTFKMYSGQMTKQTSDELIKSKRRLKKATDIAEDIFEITDKYIDSFEEADAYDYRKLKKKFIKFN